jgi:ABC-type polysaccharide/polyol phosphate transport system ATPase subunit
MNDLCVRAVDVCKSFYVLKERRTLLRTARALCAGEFLRKKTSVLHNLNFEIRKGEKYALVGCNGSGKSTLLRLICGMYEISSGALEVFTKPQALFRSWVGFNGDLPVLDNIRLYGAVHGLPRAVMEREAEGILEISKLSQLRYAPVKDLSEGQKQRLALSVFFHVDSDLLIFDESYTRIDTEFAGVCDHYFRSLRSSHKAVIMTSHDSSLLKRYCETAIWLHAGGIRRRGEIESVIADYESASR